MDSFFNIGAPELIFILLLAGIVMGPQRIRGVARWLGRITAQLQSISRSFARQLNAEIDSIDEGGDLKGAMADIQDLRRQITDLKGELTSVAAKPMRDMQDAVKESQNSIANSISIKPPDLGLTAVSPKEQEAIEAKPAIPAPTAPVQLPNLLEIPDDPD